MFDFSNMQFDPEELKRLHKKQQEAQDIWNSKEKMMKVADEIAKRINQVPITAREKDLEDDVVNLTMLTMALVADLGITKEIAANPLFAMKITQVMAVTYLLGVQKGMQSDDVPDCFKDLFKG